MRLLRVNYTVALLSNATSRLRADVTALGLNDAFDQIFNSSEIGWAKPSAEVYDYVGQSLGLEPAEWLFIDDAKANVDAAAVLGIRSHHYDGLSDLVHWLPTSEGLTF